MKKLYNLEARSDTPNTGFLATRHVFKMRVCMTLKVSLATYACLHGIESVTCYVCVSAWH